MSFYFTTLANVSPSNGFLQLGSDAAIQPTLQTVDDPFIPNMPLEDTPAGFSLQFENSDYFIHVPDPWPYLYMGGGGPYMPKPIAALIPLAPTTAALAGRGQIISLQAISAVKGKVGLAATGYLETIARGPVSIVIYQETLSGSATGYSFPVGYREYLPNSEFNPGTGTKISVTFFVASGSSGGNILRAYVGSASGTGPNFTGDQVQLTWGGLGILPSGNPGAYPSDFVNFNFTGQNLVFSADFSSAGYPPGINVATAATGPNLETYWYQNPPNNDAASTVPSGMTLGNAFQPFVSEIQVIPSQSLFTALAGRAITAVYALVNPRGTTGLTGNATKIEATARASGSFSLALSGAARVDIEARLSTPTLRASIAARALTALRALAGPAGKVPVSGSGRIGIESKALPSGSVGLAGASKLASLARAGPTTAVALIARALSAMLARAAPTGIVGLSGRSETETQARAIPAGKVPILAHANMATLARGVSTAFIVLAGRSILSLASRIAPTTVLALQARAQTQLQAKALPSGIVPALGRAMTALIARAASSGATALSGRSILETAARAIPAGAVSLLARGIMEIKSKAGATFSLALSTIAKLQSTARATPIGVLGLAARGMMATVAKATYGSVGAIALYARSMLAVTARFGPPTGKGTLFARAMTALKAQPNISGSAGLAGRSTTQTTASAPGKFSVGLAVRSLIFSIVARAAPVGSGSLSARTIAAIRAISGASGAAPLSGHSDLQTQSRASPTGKLAISARTAISLVARGLSGSAGFISLAGRSILAIMASVQPTWSMAIFGRAETQNSARGSQKLTLSLSGQARTSIRGRASPIGRVGLAATTIMRTSARVTYTALGFIALLASMLLSTGLRVFGLTSLRGNRVAKIEGRVTRIFHIGHDKDED